MNGERVGMALAFAMAAAGRAAAQAPPGTDIYLVPLERRGASLGVGAPVNITARAGYDNQPAFSPDGAMVYYTSNRGGQTDIYRYDIGSARTVQITRTPESEYSPTVMPDGRHLSVVRVELDSTQRLWQFTLLGIPVRPVFETIEPVGYHAWLGPDTAFLFVLGNPATLQRARVGNAVPEVVARDIGRSILRVPGRPAISYVQRDSAGGSVRALDPATGQTRLLAPLPPGNEFLAWTPEGELLSASGNALLRWREAGGEWEEVARFAEPGLQRISRIAVSPGGDWLVLVGEEPPPGSSGGPAASPPRGHWITRLRS